MVTKPLANEPGTLVIEKRDGSIVHRRSCTGCGGSGSRSFCRRHDSGCPCSVDAKCDDCRGEGTLEDPDCDCGVCVQLAEDLEARKRVLQ